MSKRRDGSGRLSVIPSVPWFGLVLPLLVALVAWQVTGSGLMLLFALLGPVGMVASLLDGRRQNSRRARTDAAERLQRDEREAAANAQRIAAQNAQARLEWPTLIDLVQQDVPPPALTPGVHASSFGPPSDQRSLRIGVDTESHPVLIPVSGVLRVVTGRAPRVASDAIVRSLGLTLSWWWGSTFVDRLEVGQTASSERATHVLTVRADGTADLLSAERPLVVTRVRPDVLTRQQAVVVERLLRTRDAPVSRGRVTASKRAALLAPGQALLGLNHGGGPVGLSVAEHGPHMLLAGPTGSGKTELLVTLLATWALRQTPAEFTFVIIDFKGGGGFVRLAALPHCLGITTDLDAQDVHRALVGLGHEMRRRERLLADHGVTDRDALPEHIRPARLLVVIDEFRAFSEALPEGRKTIMDVMARGRALGVHVLAATQRASGAFAEDMLANAATRICLSPVSTDDAWMMLGHRHSGASAERHALVRRHHDDVTAVHPVLCDEVTIETAERHASGASASHSRTLWWPALPADVCLTPGGIVTSACDRVGHDGAALPEGTTDNGVGLVLGLSASPESTAWAVERWDRTVAPTLRVLGSTRSGKSTLLHSLIVQSDLPVYRLPRDPVLAFDAVANDVVTAPRLVVADDIDVICGGLSDDFREDFLRLWDAVVRSTTGARGAVVTTDSGRPGAAARILSQAARHLILGLPDLPPVGESVALRPGAGFTVDRPFQALSRVGISDGDTLLVEARDSVDASPWQHSAILGELPDTVVDTALVFSSRPSLWRDRGISAWSPESWLAQASPADREPARSVVVWDSLPRAQARLVGLDPARIPPALSGTVVVLRSGHGYRRYRWGEDQAGVTGVEPDIEPDRSDA